MNVNMKTWVRYAPSHAVLSICGFMCKIKKKHTVLRAVLDSRAGRHGYVWQQIVVTEQILVHVHIIWVEYALNQPDPLPKRESLNPMRFPTSRPEQERTLFTILSFVPLLSFPLRCRAPIYTSTWSSGTEEVVDNQERCKEPIQCFQVTK